jgi:arginyl-tRNA synthetase
LVWKSLTDGLIRALESIGIDSAGLRIELAVPRDPAHGDWSTNLAMAAGRAAKKPPRAVAEGLASAFTAEGDVFEKPEVAGPGFLNFRYTPRFVASLPSRIVRDGDRFGSHDHAGGLRILVEYVSANPTGPLNVVNGRAAAVGAALVRLLRATGHDAEGEFYVNDTGGQVELLGTSLAGRFAERVGQPFEFPENGYQGEYLTTLAATLPEAEARRALDDGPPYAWFRGQALERMLASQRHDLEDYGAEFATWFRESTLHDSGAVDRALETLESRGVVYEQDGARWVRTTSFGDDKDRVVVRSNGAPTYLLPDIAYHRDKRQRGFRHAIDLWGPDHHGHIQPVQAGLESLGVEKDFLEVLIVQQVNLLSAGEQVKMSKRAGEFVTLRDLMEDVGADCAKFFFLMRGTSAHLDFDLDVARQQNDENPAYYVQYGHARICSVLRYAAERGLQPAPEIPLDQEEETLLIRQLARFPEVVRGAAAAREPHRVPTYLVETAAAFHRFYHQCRVVTDDLPRSRARLELVDAARVVLRNGLGLMGVSAPERMERTAEPVR